MFHWFIAIFPILSHDSIISCYCCLFTNLVWLICPKYKPIKYSLYYSAQNPKAWLSKPKPLVQCLLRLVHVLMLWPRSDEWTTNAKLQHPRCHQHNAFSRMCIYIYMYYQRSTITTTISRGHILVIADNTPVDRLMGYRQVIDPMTTHTVYLRVYVPLSIVCVCAVSWATNKLWHRKPISTATGYCNNQRVLQL